MTKTDAQILIPLATTGAWVSFATILYAPFVADFSIFCIDRMTWQVNFTGNYEILNKRQVSVHFILIFKFNQNLKTHVKLKMMILRKVSVFKLRERTNTYCKI